MQYRQLGKSELKVSAVALGTVELGVDYGIHAAGVAGRPSAKEAVRLLATAADAGINLFDTAPAYGDSERLVGEALGHRSDCFIATKVTVPTDSDGRPLRGAAVGTAVDASLARSAERLRRDTLDIVQIHNATVTVLEAGDLTRALLRARGAGRIRCLGASVYTEDEALLAIEQGVDVVQMPFSVLDQRGTRRVLPAAQSENVAILARSALLKGVLSVRAVALPARLGALRQAAIAVKTAWACATWDDLTAAALRFCLFDPRLASVLVGVSGEAELATLLAAYHQGPLSPAQLRAATSLAIDDPDLVNPARWGLP